MNFLETMVLAIIMQTTLTMSLVFIRHSDITYNSLTSQNLGKNVLFITCNDTFLKGKFISLVRKLFLLMSKCIHIHCTHILGILIGDNF